MSCWIHYSKPARFVNCRRARVLEDVSCGEMCGKTRLEFYIEVYYTLGKSKKGTLSLHMHDSGNSGKVSMKIKAWRSITD